MKKLAILVAVGVILVAAAGTAYAYDVCGCQEKVDKLCKDCAEKLGLCDCDCGC